MAPGRFSGPARVFGSLSAVAFASLGAYVLFTNVGGAASGLAIYTICSSVLLFLIELPSLCSCFKCAKVLQRYTRFIAGYWIARGVCYALVASGGFAIYAKAPNEQNSILLTILCVLAAVSLAYIAAFMKREDGPEGSDELPKLGAAASSFGTSFGSAAGKAIASNPQAVGAIASAAAPSLAQQMFGGFGGSSATSSGNAKGMGSLSSSGQGYGGSGATENSGEGMDSFKPGGGGVKGFYDDEESGGAGNGGGAASKESLFSGGSLFGGSSAPAPAPQAASTSSKAAKYGVSSSAGALSAPLTGSHDISEDNPFAS